jgi:hypothetical protein
MDSNPSFCTEAPHPTNLVYNPITKKVDHTLPGEAIVVCLQLKQQQRTTKRKDSGLTLRELRNRSLLSRAPQPGTNYLLESSFVSRRKPPTSSSRFFHY